MEVEPMPNPAPPRRESSKAVPVGEPPTPEGWTIPDEAVEAAAIAIGDVLRDRGWTFGWDDPDPNSYTTLRNAARAAIEAAGVGGTGVRLTDEGWTIKDVREAEGEYVPDGDPPVHYAQELVVEGPWTLVPGDRLVRREDSG